MRLMKPIIAEIWEVTEETEDNFYYGSLITKQYFETATQAQDWMAEHARNYIDFGAYTEDTFEYVTRVGQIYTDAGDLIDDNTLAAYYPKR